MKKRNRYRSMTIGMRVAPRLRSNGSLLYIHSWREKDKRKAMLDSRREARQVEIKSNFHIILGLIVSPTLFFYQKLQYNSKILNSVKHFPI